MSTCVYFHNNLIVRNMPDFSLTKENQAVPRRAAKSIYFRKKQ